MLAEINEDCLREILKYLKLKDEISLAQVCMRFKYHYDSKWAKKYITISLPLNTEIIALSPTELRGWLSGICGVVRRMFLEGYSYEKWVHTLIFEFTFHEADILKYVGQLSDNDMLTLSAAFPNVRALIIHGSFTGKNITRFTKVEDLKLWSFVVDGLHIKYLSEILQMLPLKNLRFDVTKINGDTEGKLSAETMRCLSKIEKLSVQNDIFLWMMQDTDPLENLKQLTFKAEWNLDRIFEWVRRFKRNELVEIKVMIRSWNTFPPFMEMDSYVNLTKLKLYHMKFTEVLPHLTSVLKNGSLLKLREVSLYKCHVNSASDILNFLKCSPHLELASFEGCQALFLTLDLRIPYIVHAERTSPLTVNFYDNKIAYVAPLQVTVAGDSDLVKVTNKSLFEDMRCDVLRLIFK